ncbi:hypothetical protein H5410_050302 [Solanum commersonii]|uniref:GTF3C1 extended winged-helix domain-containing protein n=1 Tax=Solanum commersonii TaxID=4109 RepID=A0A9J5WV25_SOLCO|nr:hypothetical protein H5410_050302 [Solanum commersonii]
MTDDLVGFEIGREATSSLKAYIYYSSPWVVTLFRYFPFLACLNSWLSEILYYSSKLWFGCSVIQSRFISNVVLFRVQACLSIVCLNASVGLQDVDASVPEGNGVANSQNVSTGTSLEVSDGLVLDEKICPSLSEQFTGLDHQASYVAPEDALALAVLTPPRRRSYPRCPCLTLEATSAKMEQWILEFLQEEFLVKSELYRWLQDLEKEKTTETDTKTLDCCLNKLLQGRHCKLIVVYVPVLTNCNHSRKIQVVLHPSVSSVSAEQIHERFRSFETYICTQASSQLKKGEPFPQLNDLTRTHQSTKLNQAEAIRTSGFVLAKMVPQRFFTFIYGNM